MSVNLIPIFSQTVGATPVSSVTFNNIPQVYQDLVIHCSTRRDVSTGTGSFGMQFNGITTNSYWSSRMFGYVTGTGGSQSLMTSDGYVGECGEPTEGFSATTITIPNYSGFYNKSWTSETARSTTAASTYSVDIGGMWFNPSAITSIKFLPEQSGTNWTQYTTFTIYGTQLGTAATRINNVKASGGTPTYNSDGYIYHVFSGNGTFTPSANVTGDILVVAGGGASGGDRGGGGGAGGVIYTASQSLVSGTSYAVTVGAGGTSNLNYTSGNNGGNSSFIGGAISITATGGGGGGGGNGSGTGGVNGNNGGSGGGAAGHSSLTRTGGTGVSGQGYAGGNGYNAGGAYGAGGGGGAGGAGGNGIAGQSGQGGPGVNYFNMHWGGGGGGGIALNASGYGNYGGTGGGGYSSSGGTASPWAPAPGIPNTGGGGGGPDNGSYVSASANGGSGIVIVRYLG